MDPFFLPLPVLASNSPDGRQAARQFGPYLDVALCVLKTVVERLRARLGADALEPELNRFLTANDPVAQSAVVSQLDSLIQRKEQIESVRLFRVLFVVTWDQAFDLYDCWPRWDRAEKTRCLQAAELRRLFAAFTRSTTSATA